MSEIMSRIQARLDAAVRGNEKTVRTSLRTIVGEVQTRSLRDRKSNGEITDALVMKVVKDAVSGNNDSLKHRDNPLLVAENVLLEGFLPAMMTDAQIETAIKGSGATDMPSSMKHMSGNHRGLFDGKVAKQIAMRLFN